MEKKLKIASSTTLRIYLCEKHNSEIGRFLARLLELHFSFNLSLFSKIQKISRALDDVA